MVNWIRKQLYSNDSVDRWNAIAQELNPHQSIVLEAKDTFAEVDDVKD